MARVTILMFPEPGHVIPTFRLATHLRRHGHVVTYLSTPPLVPGLRARGFEAAPIFDRVAGVDSDAEDDVTQGPLSSLWTAAVPGVVFWRQLADTIGVPFTTVRDVIRAAAPEFLVPAIAATRPDLLLCDAKIAAACGDIVRDHCGAPMIALRTELPVGDTVDCPELILCPIELEIPHWRQFMPGRMYCEASIFTERAAEAHALPAPGSGNERLIYCSLGTQAAAYEGAALVLRAVVDAFGGRPGYRLVVAAGALLTSELLRELPANVHLFESVDQLAILERASLAVLHGGLGGVKEAIMCGVPMLVVPFVFDQRPNATRVTWHGLGDTCLPGDCTADMIWQCARRLLDQPRQEATRAMQQAFRRAEEAEPAVRYVMAALAELSRGVPA
jgi:UDP:flavonoid glycosyltransferase YjiC (YdhE family)